ncbi:MAG: PA0069 family radical SAM protein [Balneolales bacterium]|nr:PA0069 family radical SAM protein [Balneolales bacterium]
MLCSNNPSNRPTAIRGRGTSANPVNRFEPLHFVQDEEYEPHQQKVKTRFLKDDSETILGTNNSPDIPFSYTLNPYRGCEHGCMYCYARPTHEYLGFSAGLDFESVIMVKEKAPQLLRKTFLKKSWQPQTIVMSGVTDPYQPAERHFELTRNCLKVFLAFRNPVSIITKNHLITRDLDLLAELAKERLVRVNISLTTLDPRLTDTLEPRTSRPQRRLEAIRRLTDAGIETGVMTAPVIPGINDHEIPALLEAAAKAGATHAGYVMLRLPWAVKDIFTDWLEQHYPDRSKKVLSRITDIHGGALYNADFANRMKGSGPFADQIRNLFTVSAQRYRLNLRRHSEPLNTKAFLRAGQQELGL